MKKIATALLCAAAFLLTSGIAVAQGQGTGVQHAASTANTQGVSHGIEKAETKQAAQKDADKPSQGKHKGKHKRGKKHHTATTAH